MRMRMRTEEEKRKEGNAERGKGKKLEEKEVNVKVMNSKKRFGIVDCGSWIINHDRSNPSHFHATFESVHFTYMYMYSASDLNTL